MNPYTGSWVLTPMYLAKQSFSPSIAKIQQVNTAFYSNQIEDPYIALEILYMMERYYSNTVADQITDRFWGELQEVKNDSDGLSFFNRVKILSCLNIVFQELFYESAVDASFNDTMRRNIISLRLDEVEERLLLDVEGSSELRKTTYLIYQFKWESPICFKIMQYIFKENLPWINTAKRGISGPSKLFERTGFLNESKKMNEVARIFFEVDGSRVKLKFQSKACVHLGMDSCVELSKLIHTLTDVSE